MAGWDLDFDVALDDVQLARGCFRVLRRTCARFYISFSYAEVGRSKQRVSFLLAFEGNPHQLGLASADFALEMRAVSLIQQGRRQRQLPLRLAHWVTYSGSDEPLRLQPPSDRVPADKHDLVIQHLTQYALAWGAWSRDEVPPADFLDSMHSLITNLALDVAEGTNKEMKFPDLVEALRLPERLEAGCKQLGTDRNRVKHRGFRHEAERYVEQHLQLVYSVAGTVTGIDAMPRTAHMLRWEDAGQRLLPPPLFDRWGAPKRFSRY